MSPVIGIMNSLVVVGCLIAALIHSGETKIPRNNYVIVGGDNGLGSDDEVRLVDYLFERQGYNPLIRPVRNLTEKVEVGLNLALIQLINVDEKNQIMKSNVWLRMLWKDYQLQWDPADYGGISVIRITASKVWKPDIVLFNNADGKYEVSYKPNVVIHSEGAVLWIPPAIYKSSCTIDVKYFPFDEQSCQMKFGSWTFNGDQVVLGWYEGEQKVDLSDYVPSGSWDVIGCPGQLDNTWDPTEQHNRSQITYTLKIRRKTLFYTVNLIIPCVLISLLSVSVFYLPADAGEKMTMCISILLALVVFLLLVSKILPPTSVNIPLIAKYLLFTFIMNIVTILITVIIINWNFRTPRTHQMPRWIRLVFLGWLPRLILMSRPRQMHHCGTSSSFSTGRRSNSSSAAPVICRSPSSDLCRHRLPEAAAGRIALHHAPYTNLADELGSRTSTAAVTVTSGLHSDGVENHLPIPMTAETVKAVDAVKFIAAHLRNEDDYAEVLEDWRYIAMVIDRLQLYIFLAVTVAGTVGILINAPHIYEYVDQDTVITALKASKNGTLNQ